MKSMDGGVIRNFTTQFFNGHTIIIEPFRYLCINYFF